MQKNRSFLNTVKLAFLMMVLLSTLFVYAPNNGHACSCAEPYPVQQELENSSEVFSGKVIEIVDQNKNVFSQSSADLVAVLFEVEQSWKGLNQKQVVVYTERSSASCGFEFALNEEYLVYAREDSGTLKAGLCSRTTLLSSADTDLVELGEGIKATELGKGQSTSFESEISNSYSGIILVSLVLGLAIVLIYIYKRKKSR